MYKYILLLIYFLSVSAGAQINDTVRITIPADTLNADTLSLADSLALADTVGLLSDSLYVIPDTINPINQKPFFNYSRFINKKEFYRRSLTYPADIFAITPFFFDISHGLSGYPDNVMIYGSGASTSSFFVNGLSSNDYSSIPFDLNKLQTEYIDSVEIIPLPRSFLYGLSNNLASVNFIGKDFLSIAPYSRIKYYEGPYGDAFVDGMFNSVIFNRFNLFIDVSNKKADSRYANTDFAQWNARFQLKYLLNNNINFISGYEYSNTKSGASGGIDILNLIIDETGFLESLYNEISTTVKFPDLRYNTYGQNVFLKALVSFGKSSFTDAGIYYRFNRFELNGDIDTSGYLDNLFKNKILGASLIQDLNYYVFNFKLLANFESADITSFEGFSGNREFSNPEVTRSSVAGIVLASLLDSIIHPSLFYKLNREKIINAEDYSGFGADLNVILPLNLKLYTGYSRIKSSFAVSNVNNFQAGVSYNNKGFNTNIGYFSREGEFRNISADSILRNNSALYYPGSIAGVGLDVNILFSKFLFEGKIDYYRENNNDLTNILPSAYMNGGVYYKDSLFSGNLDLKTGFNISYFGRRNLNLTPQFFYLYQGNTAGPDLTLNFFLSGEIQARAIIFFSWENLLDRRYFIVPFYPMPPRGIRFGVSWELFN